MSTRCVWPSCGGVSEVRGCTWRGRSGCESEIIAVVQRVGVRQQQRTEREREREKERERERECGRRASIEAGGKTATCYVIGL